MFTALAQIVTQWRARVLAIYALLVPLAIFLAGSVLPSLKAGGYEDFERESWQSFETIQREFGVGIGDIIALYTTESGTFDDVAAMGQILIVTNRLEDEPGVGAVQSFYTTRASHFMSQDRTRTFLLVDLLGDEQTKIETYQRLLLAFEADNLSVRFGGLIPTNDSIVETIRRDLTRAELLAFPITALVVLLVFRSPAAVAILLAAGGSGILFALAALRGIVTFTDVSVFAINTILLLGLGLSIDYSLFIVNRFREELPAHGVDGAILRTMATTGRAVAFSGITVAASLCGLFVFEPMMLRSLALGGIVVALGSVVLALTLVPALLSVIGSRLESWRLPGPTLGEGRAVEDSPWYRIAVGVMKRPLVPALVIPALLLLLALPFTRFAGTLGDWRILPQGDSVRETHEIITAEFEPNQSSPHVVLVTVRGDARAADNLRRLAALMESMSALPGISRVDSVFTVTPDRSIAEMRDMLLDSGPASLSTEALMDAFMAGPLMHLSLVSARPFDDPQSLDQVSALRALSTPEMQVQVAGYAAALVDFRIAIRENAPWMIAIVMGVMFVILLFAFGSITLPLKAIAMTSLSLTASFGAIVWIFQDGRLQGLLNYAPLGLSDMALPLVVFAIVFGLSMDYEVILLSRIREEYARCGDNSRAIAEGLGHTGRLITSAGAVILVVVAAFATSDIVFMKALGIAMALAILLDITVVRAMLVPATMHIMGRWNWYAPAGLRRILKSSGFDDLGR